MTQTNRTRGGTRRNRLRSGSWIGVVLVAGMLGYAAAVPVPGAKKEADDGVLFPPDRAVLLSGSFDVIVKKGEATLKVNGRPREWEPFDHPVRVTHLRLPPGVHELEIGDARRKIVVALNQEEHDGPADWVIYRHHPTNADPSRCSDCHESTEREGRIAVGELKSHEACLGCHRPAAFEATHSHPLEPIQRCAMCHALHGSPRHALLKAPLKELCVSCHDAQDAAFLPKRAREGHVE